MGFIEDAFNAAKILLLASASQMKDAVNDSTHKPAIVDFFSEHCGYSRNMAGPFTELKATYENSVTFLGVDAGDHASFTGDYKISAFPTFIGYACGHEIDRVVGATKEGVENLVMRLKDTKC